MSTFGRIIRLTTFGESHCIAVGGVLEGFPSNFELNMEELQIQLNRRKASGSLATQRQEEDRITILSGLQENITLGTPIGFMVNLVRM